MATATKTPAKRATSQTNAAAAAKSTRTSARTGSSAVKKASSKAAGVAAKTGARAAAGAATSAATGAAKKAAVKRALNGASVHAPVATRAKASRANSNGALPAELAGDVQELARDTHEGEVVRKTRASSSAGGEAASAAELAVPVQIAASHLKLPVRRIGTRRARTSSSATVF